jgi:hypothetical protein
MAPLCQAVIGVNDLDDGFTLLLPSLRSLGIVYTGATPGCFFHCEECPTISGRPGSPFILFATSSSSPSVCCSSPTRHAIGDHQSRLPPPVSLCHAPLQWRANPGKFPYSPTPKTRSLCCLGPVESSRLAPPLACQNRPGRRRWPA